MATTAEIRNKALKRLGVLGRGQTARSEDADDLDSAYQELHAELEAEGMTPWGANTADIPAQYVNSIVSLLAFSRINEYSVPTERFQRITLTAAGARRKIRSLQQIPQQGPTPIENF